MPETERWTEAFAGEGGEERSFRDLTYDRLLDGADSLPRGSVLLPDGSVVPGYPPIGRIHALGQGLARRFPDAFWAEEKIDGYNVRIARHGAGLYAFSRGGFVCPFSTDRLPDLLDPAIFDDEADLVLCAEIAGPDNPYLQGHPPQVTEDVALFVFDMLRKDTVGFLPQEERMARLDRYDLPAAPILGRYEPHETETVRELILTLDREGREGIVFKSDEDGGRRAKYSTARSNVQDIEAMSDALLDLPPEYFTNRLLRMALFMAEHGQRQNPEAERELGRAFLSGLLRATDMATRRGRVGHRFLCRFRERENACEFVDFLGGQSDPRAKFDDDVPRREGERWVVEFERIHPRMTGKLRQTLDEEG